MSTYTQDRRTGTQTRHHRPTPDATRSRPRTAGLSTDDLTALAEGFTALTGRTSSPRRMGNAVRYAEGRKTAREASRRRAEARNATAAIHTRQDTIAPVAEASQSRRGTSRARRDRATQPPGARATSSSDDADPASPCTAPSRCFGLTRRGILRRVHRLWRPARALRAASFGGGAR